MPTKKREKRKLKRQGKKGKRHIYNTHRLGHKNAGHPFGTNLPHQQKISLMEYLKTL